MSYGTGFGKVILFGEHFVVHGSPAIAAAIKNTSIVKLIKSDKNSIQTKHSVVPTLSLAGINGVLNAMGVSEKYTVILEGDLPTYGGLGSSAAFCVALVRAIAKDQKISLTNEETNKFAYEGEKAFHGNPSGVDNLVATHGGIFEFTRGKTHSENKFTKLALGKPLLLVISFSGKMSATVKMVEQVKKFKEADEDAFLQLKDVYLDLEIRAKKCLQKGKIEELGDLMNSNHALLQQLGTSDELNDKAVEIALKNHALGAKVTGGGGGGCSIALADSFSRASHIETELNKAGFKSFVTEVGI